LASFWAVIVAFGHGATPEVFILITRCQGFDVDRRQTGREVEATDQIDVAPSDGRAAVESIDGFQIACCQFLLLYPREGQSVVVGDRVGDQPGALIPDLLLRFGFQPNLFCT
jgi:hypothetical protein